MTEDEERDGFITAYKLTLLAVYNILVGGTSVQSGPDVVKSGRLPTVSCNSNTREVF